jgi:hypothetical protein
LNLKPLTATSAEPFTWIWHLPDRHAATFVPSAAFGSSVEADVGGSQAGARLYAASRPGSVATADGRSASLGLIDLSVLATSAASVFSSPIGREPRMCRSPSCFGSFCVAACTAVRMRDWYSSAPATPVGGSEPRCSATWFTERAADEM